MKRVLVDTSVFIDFLRRKTGTTSRLSTLLTDRRVLLSPYVRLELLMGVKKSERKELSSLLSALPSAEPGPTFFADAGTLLGLVKDKGINCGLVDYLIALQSLELEVPLFTIDKMLSRTVLALGGTTF